MPTRALAALCMAVVIATPGCRDSNSERIGRPSSIVATIEGVSIPLSAFEDYLAVHFVEEGLEEPLTQDQRMRVLSRLFDDFVTESLLVFEAGRRGVRVEDNEIAAWLGDDADPDPTREAARKEQARREVATRRLLDAWLRAESKLQEAEGPARGETGDASNRLASTLRRRYAIRIHPEALPFRYIADSPELPSAR